MVFRPRRSTRLVLWLCLVPALALAPAAVDTAAASAATSAAPPAQTAQSATQDSAPAGSQRLNGQSATAIADGVAQVQQARKRYPQMTSQSQLSDQTRWQIDYFAGDSEKVSVVIDDQSARVTEVWTGPQAAWQMARGYPGAFGRKVNAVFVWVPLCVLFVMPFFDPRRPWRLLHLDLLMLLAFSVSLAFFNHGKVYASTPLVYPVLIYLLLRMLACGFRPRQRLGQLVPVISTRWLGLGVLFLLGFRIALNILDSNVVDIGYSGVIGAHHITHGGAIYGAFPSDNAHGDTYGPFNYLAYVPFELIWPWSGHWDSLPAAHAAAISFDLLTVFGLFVLGRQLARSWAPGRFGLEANQLGIALAFAWVSYPFTLFVLNTNVNDSLVALLVVWALVAITSPAARGAVMALAAGTKFAPLGLVPLFARGLGGGSRRSWLVFSGVFLTLVLSYALPFVLSAGPVAFFDRTLGYQGNRGSPFSIWGLLPALSPLHIALGVAVIGFCVLVGLVPRRRTTVQVAALACAVTLALQLVIDHWFYLYIVWFAPAAFVAFFCAYMPRSVARHEAGRRAFPTLAGRSRLRLVGRSLGLRPRGRLWSVRASEH